MTSRHASHKQDARFAGFRHLAHTAMLCGATALGINAFGLSAVAHAEWDIEAYDQCMGTPHKEDPQQSYHAICCVSSGGEWNGSKCTAPAAELIQNIPLGPRLGTVGQATPPIGPVTAPVA